jgi:hypothetical protein
MNIYNMNMEYIYEYSWSYVMYIYVHTCNWNRTHFQKIIVDLKTGGLSPSGSPDPIVIPWLQSGPFSAIKIQVKYI